MSRSLDLLVNGPFDGNEFTVGDSQRKRSHFTAFFVDVGDRQCKRHCVDEGTVVDAMEVDKTITSSLYFRTSETVLDEHECAQVYLRCFKWLILQPPENRPKTAAALARSLDPMCFVVRKFERSVVEDVLLKIGVIVMGTSQQNKPTRSKRACREIKLCRCHGQVIANPAIAELDVSILAGLGFRKADVQCIKRAADWVLSNQSLKQPLKLTRFHTDLRSVCSMKVRLDSDVIVQALFNRHVIAYPNDSASLVFDLMRGNW